MKRLLMVFALLLVAAVSLQAQGDTYTTIGRVRVRAEPNTTSAIVARLGSGVSIAVVDTVEGARVSGSTTWYEVAVGSGRGYIHSSLLRAGAPAASSSSGGSTASSTAGGTTPSTCPRNCTEAVAMGLTAEQAAACGRYLDRDGDGRACHGD